MAFKLFKNGDDLHENGDELIKRGEWQKARNVLQKSVDKDGGDDSLALVKIALIDLKGQLNNPDAYRNLASKADAISSRGDIEFGITSINLHDLIIECGLTARKLEALNSGTKGKEKADVLQAIATDMQEKIGQKTFIIKQLFSNDSTTTGESEFYNLMALSYETLADEEVWNSPQKAAEYQQIAMGYRQQNGQTGEENMNRIRQYSCTSKCWMCGRISTGEGIHFFQTPAEVSDALNKTNDGSMKSAPDNGHIYICRACYTAVSKRADEISTGYYNRAIDEIRSTEVRLQAEIASLQAQITSLRLTVR